MLVTTRGKIGLDLRRIIDIEGNLARLEPIAPGTEEMQVPTSDLLHYQIKTSDEVFWEGRPVTLLTCLNPDSLRLYDYEVEDEDGEVHEVNEFRLIPREGAYPADPVDMMAQRDFAEWPLVSGRMSFLESYFQATAKSLGLAGYQGARMLPIPHQLSAARYAILFGRVRFLLADEVGLGKTVEAGLIVATLRKYFPEWQAAIFVPESLTVQWAFEMYGKFGKQIFALDPDEFDEDSPGIILPHDKAPWLSRKKKKPEILVVDEAHRVLRDEKIATALTKLSEKAHAVLLLTATPRSDDSDNVTRLLKLCDPERFGHVKSDADIQHLLEIQPDVEKVIQELRSHETTLKKAQDAWKSLKLKDKEIDALVKTKGAKGKPDRHALSHAAALLVDRYYPGSRILRYQRKFLAEDNAMAFRVVDKVVYKPTEEERDMHALCGQWFKKTKKPGKASEQEWQAVSSALLQAMHSSPLAVSDWISARQGKLEPREGVSADPIRLLLPSAKNVKPAKAENELLTQMEHASTHWMAQTRHDRAAAIPLSLLPRFQSMLQSIREYLEFAPEARLIVFTAFESNVRPIFQLLRRELEGKMEVFHIDATQPWRNREKNTFQYQECETACLLVSDELGGEGRNFQFADAILHFDLPPSPWLVEQRIGRCDRVGREQELDVESVVFTQENGLDDAVFDFLAEGVNVFNESIAPVEGSMARVTRQMLEACLTDGPKGVRDLIKPIKKDLEKARNLHESELISRSRVGVAEAKSLSVRANDSDELERLQKNALHYARLFESSVDEQRNRIHITVGEFHSLRGEPGVLPEMYGHFNRREAVKKERLEFFSPGHPFIRGMAVRALQDQPDRTAIVMRNGADIPVVILGFTVRLDGSFFSEIRELPVDLRPPLFCKSAEVFGTQFIRFAIDFKGKYLEPTDPKNVIFYDDYKSDDVSLHDPKYIKAIIPGNWADILSRISNTGYNLADEAAAKRLNFHREPFEDLLCEVLTRIFPTQEWLEERVTTIMESLARLVVELDSAVLMIPGMDPKK
jgi:superfamily II DNA/RNA helicase